jgi:hypothetical protein
VATDGGILVWRNVHDIAEKVCRQFGLRYGKIEPETNLRVHKYGEALPCDRCHTNSTNGNGIALRNCHEKIIKIRIHQIYRPNRALSLRTIIDTLAHELAHLRSDCWEHGKPHTKFTREILDFIKEIGYTW